MCESPFVHDREGAYGANDASSVSDDSSSVYGESGVIHLGKLSTFELGTVGGERKNPLAHGGEIHCACSHTTRDQCFANKTHDQPFHFQAVVMNGGSTPHMEVLNARKIDQSCVEKPVGH